jgi:DNA-binding CsgD family transcriptional regulator
MLTTRKFHKKISSGRGSTGIASLLDFGAPGAGALAELSHAHCKQFMNGDNAAKVVSATTPSREVQSPASASSPHVLAIGRRACRLVCVDDVVPMHIDAARNSHPRFVYAAGEIVHFDLDGHRWAIVADHQPAGEPDHPAKDLRALLTNRELQIVQLICLGLLTKQVADRLHLSEFTVRSYLKTVYCKLGVRSRGAMVFRYAQMFTHGAPLVGDDGKTHL